VHHNYLQDDQEMTTHETIVKLTTLCPFVSEYASYDKITGLDVIKRNRLCISHSVI
jgi:hypothetical protein